MTVRQAANVLDLLEFFAREQRAASLAEISAHFGWPRSSTFNLITTLAERGFLYEPRPRGGYYPTPRWLSLAQEVAAAEPLPEKALELMRALAETSGETVWIAAQSGAQAIFLAVMLSPRPVRYMAEPGFRVPLHGTASGQAILSQMRPAQIAAILRRADYVRYGEGTPMSAAEVEENIARSLARGWFASASAFSQDLGGVSVPLVLGGRPFALTVAGPLNRIEPHIEETAQEIHRAIALHFGPSYLEREVPNLHRLAV